MVKIFCLRFTLPFRQNGRAGLDSRRFSLTRSRNLLILSDFQH